MIVWQANLGRGVTAARFRANARKVLDAGGSRAVFCFQEIDEADLPNEMDYLTDVTARTHVAVGVRTAVPIFVPRHLPVLDERLTLGCRGLAKFTPNRPINEVVVSVGPNLDVALFNFHVPLDRPQTESRRTQIKRNVKTRARRHDNGMWVADTNHHRGWPTIVPGERSVVDAGIDKGKAWAGEGRRVVVSDRRSVNLTMDGHDAHGARVRWERR